MADALELDALWEDFHRVLNPLPAEAGRFLAHAACRVSDQAGLPRSIPAGLKPARFGTTSLDVHVLSWFSISTVYALDSRNARHTAYPVPWPTGRPQGAENEPEPDDSRLRHRLMTVGHDPLKP